MKKNRHYIVQLTKCGTSLKYKTFRLLLVAFSLLLTLVATAQQYPVQVINTVIPPYSTKLNDYTTANDIKLRLNLLLTDVTINNRQVRLKLRIKGSGFNVQSANVVVGAPQIYLNGGVLQQLTNLDLKAYFELQNLVGINPQQYSNSLPDGTYSFCWEVFDFLTGQQISNPNTGCVTTFLLLNDPPFLNMPNRGDQIVEQDPMNIIFQWTPRHANATNVSYEFELRELWDNQIDPQAAFLASPNYYTETSYATALLYNITKPTLLLNKTYAWRVRAISKTGLSENAIFKNNGYSEIYYFTLTKNCASPLYAMSEALNESTAKISWQPNTDHTKYHVQYKRADIPDAEWFEVYAFSNQVQIENLEKGETYSFRVGGTCTALTEFTQAYSYTSVNQFTMPTDTETAYFNCGISPEIKITNQNPLPIISPNESFTAGDFPIVIREVSGSNGKFSGWGYTTLPFLEQYKNVTDALNKATHGATNLGKFTRIRVAFQDISINTDYQLTDGVVQTTFDPEWGGMVSGNEVIDAVGDAVFGDDGKVSNNQVGIITRGAEDIVVKPNGDIVISGTNGNTTISTSLPAIITDASTPPNKYAVSKDGEVTELGPEAEGGTPKSSNTNGIAANGNVNQISSKDVSVVFNASGYYGTDSLSKGTINNNYETISQANGDTYNVLYKAISNAPKETDVLTATATLNNGKTTNDIIFKTDKGVAVPFEWSGNTATLTIKNQFEFGKDAIIATVKPTDSTGKYDIAGKVNVWHLQQKQVNVVLVGINGTVIPNDSGDVLNQIYNKAGVHFVITKKNIDISNTWGESVETGDSDLLNTYTNEQQSITQALITALGSEYKTDAYYMLYTPEKADNGDAGFMPLKRQFGFVFDGKNRTLAHELGHGVFGLKHPFSNKNESGKTDLLMDYGSGTTLSHMDWELMHAPGLQLYQYTQGSEDGAAIQNFADENYYNIKDNKWENYAFLSPIGTVINLDGVSDVKFNEDGAVLNFKKDEKTYFGVLSVGTQRFVGYLSQDDKSILNKHSFLTVEFEEEFNKKKFTGITYSAKNKEVIAYSKQKDGDNYLDCLRKSTWINKTVATNYTGITNPPFIPEDAISLDISGNQCLNFLADGIHDGVGKDIYINLKSLITENQKPQLVELANYFTDSISDKKFAFYGYGLEDYYSSGVFNEQIILYLKNNKIWSKTLFKQKFPYIITQSRDFGYVFSNIDIWSYTDSDTSLGIPKGYNTNSVDYVTGKQGKIKSYEYSFSDLVVRKKYFLDDNFIRTYIHKIEVSGNAESIAEHEFYAQYIARYGTNDAYPFLAITAANLAKDVMAANFLRQLTAQYGVMLINEAAKQLGKEAFKKLIKEKGKDFLQGAVIDYGIQTTFTYLFDDKTFSQAASPENINWISVGASGLEGTLSYNNKYSEYGVSLSFACFVNGWSDTGGFKDDFDVKNCAIGVVGAGLGKQVPLIFKYAKKYASYSVSKLKAGLAKLNITGQQADEIIEKIKNDVDEGSASPTPPTGEIIYLSVKINGIPVVRIWKGNNDKIAIIGRKMLYVRQVANDLKSLGKEVEIFEPNSAFGGKGYDKLTEIYADFDRIKIEYPDGNIPYNKLKETLWYKENERWAKWIKEQGYDIYDLGDNPGQFINSADRLNVPDASAFFDMEKIVIFKSK
ncbi:hypothetical protein ACFFU9_07765 [Mariniflexile ostreae]|uniref:Fibronectin type-III domain-containing protein n=1 Tax=Mariniflexile ostreae TaxID=1520892 RepID=A0ABV5FB10_9FLAO